MIVRTYPLKHSLNAGKEQKLRDLIVEYRVLAENIAQVQWVEFFKKGSFNKNLDIKELASKLSARYKQTCQYQVVGTLNSLNYETFLRMKFIES